MMCRLAMVLFGVAAAQHEDLYQCDAAKLVSENLCYMVPNVNNTVGASPNHVDRTVAPDGFRKVLDAEGTALSLTPKPWTQGDQLGASATSVDGDLLAYALAFEMIAPLRNAMMYAPKSVTDNETQWTNLTSSFKACGVKAKDSSGEHGVIYSVDSIYKVVKDPKGQDTHHSIMRFLEEGAIDMVCLMTSLSGSFCRTTSRHALLHTFGFQAAPTSNIDRRGGSAIREQKLPTKRK